MLSECLTGRTESRISRVDTFHRALCITVVVYATDRVACKQALLWYAPVRMHMDTLGTVADGPAGRTVTEKNNDSATVAVVVL